jgi:hypothetical protein
MKRVLSLILSMALFRTMAARETQRRQLVVRPASPRPGG